MGNLQFKRGLKSKLPTSAPSGMPLWCIDTKELYIGTENGIQKVGSSSDGSIITEITQKSVNILPTNGIIELQDNSVNTIEVNGDVVFVLPELEDNTIFHEILVQVSMPKIVSFDLGTKNYITSEPPDMSSSGIYNILFEFHEDTWFVGVVKKNGILGQKYIKFDFDTYNGNAEININNGQDFKFMDSDRPEDCIAYYQKGVNIDYSINCYIEGLDWQTETGSLILEKNTTIYVPDLFKSPGQDTDDLEDVLG